MKREISTPDGRTLSLHIDGDPDGRPVLVHNGTPSSGLLFEPAIEDARSRGLQLIGYDRPGYGGSTPQPGRTVADCTNDVRAIAEQLSLERLAVWGISGGGPHALACAALLPDLVTAVASLAAIAPYGAPGLDFFAGMGQENIDDVRLAVEDRAAARAKVEQDRLDVLATPAEGLTASIATLVSPVDAAAMQDPSVAAYLSTGFHGALAPGPEGWWEDGLAHIEPWGFDFAQTSVPVLLMHGGQDRFVPITHGEWLATQIPGVEARLLPDDGHLTLLTEHIGEVHAWLAERL